MCKFRSRQDLDDGAHPMQFLDHARATIDSISLSLVSLASSLEIKFRHDSILWLDSFLKMAERQINSPVNLPEQLSLKFKYVFINMLCRRRSLSKSFLWFSPDSTSPMIFKLVSRQQPLRASLPWVFVYLCPCDDGDLIDTTCRSLRNMQND